MSDQKPLDEASGSMPIFMHIASNWPRNAGSFLVFFLHVLHLKLFPLWSLERSH